MFLFERIHVIYVIILIALTFAFLKQSGLTWEAKTMPPCGKSQG